MNEQLKKHYQWLQDLAVQLQWPKADWTHEEIDRQTAKTLIENIGSSPDFGFNPKDQDFFLQVALKLGQLIKEELEFEEISLPPHLDELVKNYEEHLKEKEKTDQNLPPSYQQIRRRIKAELEEKFEAFRNNPFLNNDVCSKTAEELVEKLPPTRTPEALGFEDYQAVWEENKPKLVQKLKQAGVALKSEEINKVTQNLAQETFESAQSLATQLHQLHLEPTRPLKKLPPEPKVVETPKVFEAKAEFGQKVGLALNHLRAFEKLNPEEKKRLNKTAQRIIAANLPPDINKANFNRIVNQHWQEIEDRFAERGFSCPPKSEVKVFVESLAQNWRSALRLIQATPRLPPEAATAFEKQAKGEMAPAYFWQFNFLKAYIKRAVLGPAKKTCQFVVNEAVDQNEEILQKLEAAPGKEKETAAIRNDLKIQRIWQTMAEDGWFFENLQDRLTILKKAGVSPENPYYQALERETENFFAVQKNPKGKDWPAVKILKSGWELRRPSSTISPTTNVPLPSFREISGLTERIWRRLSGGRLTSFSHLQKVIYQKTIGRVLTTLGKTGLGQAIKTSLAGIKPVLYRAASWLAAKLGITLATEGGLLAAAAAAAPETFGLSLVVAGLITAAVELGKRVFGKVGDWIKSAINSLKRNPEKSVALIGGGIIAAVALPAPIGLIVATGPIIIGGLGIASLGTTSLGVTAGGLANGIVALLAAFLVIPILPQIILIILGSLAVLIGLTLFIVFLTAGAFILPIDPTQLVAPSQQQFFEVIKTVDQKEIQNNQLTNNPLLTYTISVSSQEPITITSVQDQKTINCQGASPPLPAPPNFVPPSSSITNWTSNAYTVRLDPSFTDCRLCNTVTVTADVPSENKTGVRNSASQCVRIGSPPEDCPDGWPSDHGYITQGPNANWSHQGMEAIDIGLAMGTPIKATHEGEVVAASSGWGGGEVKIAGTCGPYQFTSRYLHLLTKSVQLGDRVAKGQIIGTSGTAGTGPHLHYQFLGGLEMASPYIPIDDDVLEKCNSKQECHLSW